jgi:hypothetical protein
VRKTSRGLPQPPPAELHFDHIRSGRGAHVDIDLDLFNCNPYYRCVVLARLAWEAHRDVDWMTTRELLSELWSEGGDARTAALDELRVRWYGNRRRVA